MITPTPTSTLRPLALVNLTFISDCQIPADERYDTIEVLLRHASRANAIDDITGVLLLSGNQFVHTLEGPAAAVDSLMARITVDPRHADIVIVDRRPVAYRAFVQWGLAYQGSSVSIGRMVAGALRGDQNDLTRLLQLISEFGKRPLPPQVL